MDGVLLINKEKDYTSRDIVNVVSKYLNTKKIGHAGTLDPLAKGLLVLAVNKATKIIEFLTYDDKEYIAEVKCGIKTDTLDITGNILEEDNHFVLEKEKLENILSSFIGKYMQEVPIYSSIKVSGKRLYQYAREKIEVVLPIREVEIKEIELLSISKDSFKFRTVVSKGTYIRSLIRDIGNRLNILCSMSNLKRVREGIFSINDSYTLKDVEEGNYKLLSIKDALINYMQIEVDESVYNKIKNGNKLKNIYNVSDLVVFTYNNEVVGIYENKDGVLRAKRVF